MDRIRMRGVAGLAVGCGCLLASTSMAAVVYVKTTAAGLNNGTSWANAYTELRTALANNTSAEIWVATGVYFPANPVTPDSGYALRNNSIYGGFAGAETSRQQRNPALYPVVLSGDGVTTNLVLKRGVYIGTSVLDGLTLRDSAGASQDNLFGHPGGALNVLAGGVVVTNCFFLSNKAFGRGTSSGTQNGGGAIHFASSSGRLTVRNSRFSFNTTVGGGSMNGGGAIAISYAGGPVVIEDSLFQTNWSNSAGQFAAPVGGAIMNNTSLTQPVILRRCLFEGNSANTGGAITMSGLASYTVDSCTFIANEAKYSIGGAIDCDLYGDARAVITRSRFIGNRAIGFYLNYYGAAGGAITVGYDDSGSSVPVTVEDCYFENCSARYSGGAIFVARLADCSIVRSVFRNCSARWGGAVCSASSQSVSISDSRFENNVADDALGRGGAVYYGPTTSRILVQRSVFTGNLTEGNGGALYVETSAAGSGLLVNLVMAENQATDGGGIYIQTGRLNLLHCTVVYNRGTRHGGALWGGPYAVSNSIVRFNSAVLAGATAYSAATNRVSFTDSFTAGPEGSIPGEYGSSVVTTFVRNRSADPLFVDAAALDFQLLPVSPAINPAGLVAHAVADPDAAGVSRSGRLLPPDAGAYEYGRGLADGLLLIVK